MNKHLNASYCTISGNLRFIRQNCRSMMEQGNPDAKEERTQQFQGYFPTALDILQVELGYQIRVI